VAWLNATHAIHYIYATLIIGIYRSILSELW
jgi:hypothetical protein